MTTRNSPIVRFGLGLLVGAIFHSAAFAQVTPPTRADSARQDSLRARQLADSLARAAAIADSLAREKAIADSIARGDTLRAPLIPYGQLESVDETFVWSGDQISASGAVTLSELLSRVPGAASFRAGFAVAPSVTAYAGCIQCVRVYLDGVELAAPDHRAGGVLDHADVALWTLSEVRVVRSARELRVYLTTWGVERTIPFSRLDILTGSDDVTLFGAYFGRRFKHGEVLQLAGQQFATKSRVGSGSGDRGALQGRFGIVRENWGLDLFLMRISRFREAQSRIDGGEDLPQYEGSRTDAILSLALGRPSSGRWLRVSAASMNASEKTPNPGPPPPAEGEPPGPSADTSRTESQYLVSGGLRLSALGLTGSARFRSLDGDRSSEFALTGRLKLGPALVTAYGRRDTRDSTISGELSLNALPLRFLSLYGSVGQSAPIGSSQSDPAFFANGEVGLKVGRAWLKGGVLSRDSVNLAAPIIFHSQLTPVAEAGAVGVYAAVNGKIWRDIGADAKYIKWDSDGWYRPSVETQARLYVDTGWLRKFPTGNFHFYAGITYENREAVMFPVSGGSSSLIAPTHTTISSLVEIRILSAVISWQQRNIRGLEQFEVPGLAMPRRLSVYGVRWVLWD